MDIQTIEDRIAQFRADLANAQAEMKIAERKSDTLSGAIQALVGWAKNGASNGHVDMGAEEDGNDDTPESS
jgi:hypothetical protein